MRKKEEEIIAEEVTGEALTEVPAEIAPTQEKSTRRFMIETLQTLILALVLYFLIDAIVARVEVLNISMQPTLHEGQFLLVSKLAYRFGDYQRGDIIVFHYPANPQEDYIKRLIGLPGDVVTVTGGVVKVNGLTLEEPYIAAPPSYTGEWKVPAGMLFVLGDNRNQSSDSHAWGFVPLKNVIGKAIFIYWPVKEFGIIEHHSLMAEGG